MGVARTIEQHKFPSLIFESRKLSMKTLAKTSPMISITKKKSNIHSPHCNCTGLKKESLNNIMHRLSHLKEENNDSGSDSDSDIQYPLPKSHNSNHLHKNTGKRPPNALAVGTLHESHTKLYAVVAHTEWGSIPGQATANHTCFFGYGGKEHSTKDFSWVCSYHHQLKSNPSATERQHCLCVGNVRDAAGQLWVVVAHTKRGDIPGKGRDGECWFTIDGKEERTQEFSYLVLE